MLLSMHAARVILHEMWLLMHVACQMRGGQDAAAEHRRGN
jgi:hypothetical protein